MIYSTCNNVICSCIDGDDLIQRTIIIGILLEFRKLSLQALRVVLERRIPFMFSSILDFKSNLIDKDSRVCYMYDNKYKQQTSLVSFSCIFWCVLTSISNEIRVATLIKF